MAKTNNEEYWTPLKLTLLSSFVSAISTVIAVIVTVGSVFLVVELTQNNDEEQEKKAVLRLLNVARQDILQAGFIIQNIENIQSQKGEDAVARINLWKSDSNILPYPIILERVMSDNRVLLNLSDTSLSAIYDLEEKLSEDRYAILSSKESNLLKMHAFKQYKLHIQGLYLILDEEIKYQKGESNEEEIRKIYKDVMTQDIQDLKDFGILLEDIDEILSKVQSEDLPSKTAPK